MNKRVIINADDFGFSEGVNKAIARAHTDGVVTSTTIMANMPAADQAVKIARKLPKLGVGVHLNLTEGRPLSNQADLRPLLDSSGNFSGSIVRLALFALAGPNGRRAIAAELSAQIQWLIDKGITPTHLDSHKHIHTLPHIFSMVCELARRFKIPAIRFAFEPKKVSAMPWPLPGTGGRTRAKRVSAAARINRFQNREFFATDALLGLAHMGRIDVTFFKAVALYSPGPTAEVMTHPAIVHEAESQDADRLAWRKVELDALCSEKTKQFFKDSPAQLVHYGQL
jgi:hopanoid biosynthesis associated protein HpnK